MTSPFVRIINWKVTLACIACAFLLTASSGCTDTKKQATVSTAKPKVAPKSKADNVSDAMKYLSLLMRLDRSVAVDEVAYQLNGWARTYNKTNDGWQMSPLAGSLSQQARQSLILGRLGEVQFLESECEYLLQCQMMTQVCDWVLDKPYTDTLLSDWVTETADKLPDAQRRQLNATVKLFDWTARNVALEGNARDAEKLLKHPNWPLNDTESGYRQLPWQTMIYARGDAWLRARVFTQLLQQADVSSVALAIEDAESKELNMWAIGVPIGEEIYLFEPQWGLPIPGPGEIGIATLKDAKSDPSVLRRANLPGQFEYPVTTNDLSRLVALIDVEPFAFSHAMFAIEPMLAGTNRMNVYVDVNEVVTQLEKSFDTQSIRMWELPLMATHYNVATRKKLFDQNEFSFNYISKYGVFFTDTAMNQARKDHFEGAFEPTDDRGGALKNYMSLRVDDATLDKLSFDPQVQASMNFRRGKSESVEQFIARANQLTGFYKSAKFQSSSFLALVQYELGNIDAAIDWLDTRTLKVSNTQAWHPHAEYMLSRCHELKNDYDKAIDFLRREDRPQEAGNRIRARLLQAKSDKP
jgi:hypothetical protein